MLRITVSRIRVFFAVLGCAILSASLFDWAQSLRAAESGYAWVKAAAPIASAAETAEIWQISASCVRPFFVNAVLQSKLRLASHYALAPDAVRAWGTRPLGEGPQPATDQSGGLYRLASAERANRAQHSAQSERGAMLHVRYAEWYANLFKLKVAEHAWERRLASVADQSVTVSAATRRNFGAYGDRGIERVGGQGDFDHYLLVLLGLGGFSDDQEQALRVDCMQFMPVKRIFRNANYLGEFWRWPVDHAAAFSFGLELMLIGIFFAPIDLWIGTGDMQAVRRHIGDAVNRFGTKVRSLANKIRSQAFARHWRDPRCNPRHLHRSQLSRPGGRRNPFRVQTCRYAAAAPRPRCPRAHRLQKNHRGRHGMVQAGNDVEDNARDALNAGALLPKNRDCDMSQRDHGYFSDQRGEHAERVRQ